jgi:probable F420-dependent oxidoreductase
VDKPGAGGLISNPHRKDALRPFRFGVQLFTADSAKDWTERARRAEQLGYSVLTMPDHVAEHLAPIPALAAIAASTKSIRLGTMVMSNDWRNPVLLAREAATLDWLSGGRLEFGVGAGWLGQDYTRMGVPYDAPGVRIDRLGESLEIMKDLLSGKTITRSGRYYHVVDASSYPAAIQKPHPPIAIGGGSRRILSLGGRLADIVNVHANIGAGQRGEAARPDWGELAVDERINWIREGAGDRFKEIELGLRVPMAAVTDRREVAAAQLGSRSQLGASEVLASPYALVGSVESISHDLLERRERFGFSYFLWNESELEAMAPVVSRMVGR